jgi:hypothetical protein
MELLRISSLERETVSPTKSNSDFQTANLRTATRDATAEDFGAHKFEGFLVVASSKGDTLSLFELKR